MKGHYLISKKMIDTFLRVDICDATKIKKIFDYFLPDIVIHLASETHVDDQLMIQAILLKQI